MLGAAAYLDSRAYALMLAPMLALQLPPVSKSIARILTLLVLVLLINTRYLGSAPNSDSVFCLSRLRVACSMT